MKTGFKDPIAPKEKGKSVKNPWDFSAPDYDSRSSCYVSAGTHHGVGHRQPVGHQGNPKETAAVLPKGRVNTMQVSNISYERTNVED